MQPVIHPGAVRLVRDGRVFCQPGQLFLSAAFGDDEEALAMYDTETVPVPSAPAAAYFQVEDGKITRLRFIFDRVPYEAAGA